MSQGPQPSHRPLDLNNKASTEYSGRSPRSGVPDSNWYRPTSIVAMPRSVPSAPSRPIFSLFLLALRRIIPVTFGTCYSHKRSSHSTSCDRPHSSLRNLHGRHSTAHSIMPQPLLAHSAAVSSLTASRATAIHGTSGATPLGMWASLWSIIGANALWPRIRRVPASLIPSSSAIIISLSRHSRPRTALPMALTN